MAEASNSYTKMFMIGYKELVKGVPKKAIDTLTLYINPDQYSVTYGFPGKASPNKSGSKKHQKSGIGNNVVLAGGDLFMPKNIQASQNITFKLTFDNTGAIPESRDVATDLKKLQLILVGYEGDIHSTPYVKMFWGEFHFVGQAQSLSISYELFDAQGKPIRAVANITLTKILDPETQAAQKGDKSPDLTHLRVVKDGDNLPLLCQDIYRDPKYYLQVAQANELSSIMQLEPGQSILFPPLEK